MTSFEPPQLRQTLGHALKVWSNRIDEDPLEGIPSVEEWDDDDSTITNETVVTVTLPNWPDVVELSVAQFVQLVNEFEQSRFIHSVGYLSQTPHRSLWRVTPQNALAHKLMSSDAILPDDAQHREQLMALSEAVDLYQKLDSDTESDPDPLEMTDSLRKALDAQIQVHKCRQTAARVTVRRYAADITHQGHNFRVCLVNGFTPFALHLVESGLGHEYFPPVDDSSEAFVEVTSSKSFREEEALLLTHAYLFELSATVRAEFAIEPRQEVDEDPLGEFSDELTLPNRLRPLCTGKGMTELLSLYNRGVGTSDDELRILCFAKVVEYVAQSVIRRQATEVIRGKLMSDRALTAC